MDALKYESYIMHTRTRLKGHPNLIDTTVDHDQDCSLSKQF